MKSITLLFCVLFIFQLKAQNTSGSCKTIILNNDFEITANISSFEKDYLIYRNCPDTSLATYNLPIRIINTIRDSMGQPDPLFAKLTKLQTKQSKKAKKMPIKAWIFKNKLRKMVRAVSEGSVVKVKYLDSANQAQKVKGKWIKLTENALVLETKKELEFSILKEKIIKIKIPNPKKAANRAAGGVAAVASIAFGIIAFIILSAAIVSTFVFVLTLGLSGSSESTNTGCGLGIIALLLMAGSLALLITSGTKTITEPFDSTKWELIYPTEVQQQESTKQP